jgi:hypothetical protein
MSPSKQGKLSKHGTGFMFKRYDYIYTAVDARFLELGLMSRFPEFVLFTQTNDSIS